VSLAAATMIGSRVSREVDLSRSQLGDQENASPSDDECRVTRDNILVVSGWSLRAGGPCVAEVEPTAGAHRQVTQAHDVRQDVAAASSTEQGAAAASG
jgi:hypothetical protein